MIIYKYLCTKSCVFYRIPKINLQGRGSMSCGFSCSFMIVICPERSFTGVYFNLHLFHQVWRNMFVCFSQHNTFTAISVDCIILSIMVALFPYLLFCMMVYQENIKKTEYDWNANGFWSQLDVKNQLNCQNIEFLHYSIVDNIWHWLVKHIVCRIVKRIQNFDFILKSNDFNYSLTNYFVIHFDCIFFLLNIHYLNILKKDVQIHLAVYYTSIWCGTVNTQNPDIHTAQTKKSPALTIKLRHTRANPRRMRLRFWTIYVLFLGRTGKGTRFRLS